MVEAGLMRIFVWSCVILGGLAAAAGPLAYFGLSTGCRCSNDRNAGATLKGLVSAQAWFRDNDCDGDGLRDYWREDVAGLYNVCAPGTNEAIKLIELSAACADLTPLWAVADGVDAPKAGYWYAALRFEDEAAGAPDVDRFVVCAVPDSLAAGKVMLAVTHEGVVWEKPAGRARDIPPDFPLDPASAGWRKRLR
jgi:hypothetical protein